MKLITIRNIEYNFTAERNARNLSWQDRFTLKANARKDLEKKSATCECAKRKYNTENEVKVLLSLLNAS